MWILKDIVFVVGLVIMAIIFVVNAIGIAFNIQQIRHEIVYWGVSWFELLSLIFMVAFWVVVIRLILRLNKYEKAKLLSNKDDLIRALQKVAQSSCEVFIVKERIANSQKVSPNLVNTELSTELDNAESSLHEKNKDLDAELAVAGQKYRECISDVTNFISAQLSPSVKGVLNNRDYQEKLRLKMNETIQRIQD